MRGRIGKRWGAIVQKHYKTTKATKGRNRDTWEIKTIDKILAIFDATWTARNALMHGATDDENNKLKETRVNEQITKTYRYDRNDIAPQDQRLFHTPLTTILHKSLALKNAWLKSINTAKSAWAKEQGAENPIDRGPNETIDDARCVD